MKRHKDPSNTPIENGDTEVFVLPPDLLEQLGIQLSNITCPPESLGENSIEVQSTKNNAETRQSTEATSILETANLMKKSVFMSPTFVSTTETISELPSVATEAEKVRDINELQQFVVNDVLDIDTADNTVIGSNDINPTVRQQVEDNMDISQSIKVIENRDLFPTNVSYESSNGVNIDLYNFNKTTTSIDEHVDEAYSSDGSNCNSRTGLENINNNMERALEQQKTSNKIKIISEQIINHLELKTVEISRTKKNSCFLIPVNTIVTGKSIRDQSNNLLERETVQEELCITPRINTKVHNQFGEIDHTNHILETIRHKDTVSEDLLNDTCPSNIEPSVIKEETSHKVNTEDKSYDKREMEWNIDKQISDKDDRNNDYLKKVSIDGNDKEINDFTKEIVSNTKKNFGKSKLCIQGVEKPGGMCEKHKVLKTYQRTNIRKRIPEIPRIEIVVINTMDSNTLPENVIDLNKIYIGGDNKFCVCNDFGQLVHYDRDTAYEHLHFRDHNSACCNIETLFSMYDDTANMPEFNVTEDIDVVNEDVETVQNGICWLSFVCGNNFEVDITESKISEEFNQCPGQLRRSNRKRKSTITENVTESIESKPKKTVKCGACGLILLEAEWNKHKESEHNLIAWKDGQTIVKHISTTTASGTLPDEAIEIKDETLKQTKSTRRTSRNLKLESGEIKSEINNDGVSASSKQILKSTSIEADNQYVEGPTKSTRTSLGVSSKSTEIKVTPKAEAFSKTTRRTSDGFQNAIQLKDKPKSYGNLSTKSSKKSIDVSSKTTENKRIVKTEVKEFPKTNKVKDTPKSMNIHGDVRTISNFVDEIIDTSYSSPTPKTEKCVEVSSDVTAISKNIIDTSNKSSKKLNTTTSQKLKVVTPPTSNNLREIDIFSTPTSRKTNIDCQHESMKHSKDDTTKPKSVEITPKSISRDVSSKRTKKILEVEGSNKLKRKSHNAEASLNIDSDPKSDENDISSTFVVVEIPGTSNSKTVDEIPRKCIRKMTSIDTVEDVSLKSTRKSQEVDTKSKSQLKNQSPKNSKKKSSDVRGSETISTIAENDVNLKSLKKTNNVTIEVPPVDLTPKSSNVEIEIPVHNHVAQSITTENSNKSQAVEEFAVSIKKEILPQCGVCKQQVEDSLWIEHIAKEHDYLAWREDEAPLDLENDEEVRAHLNAIAKANGGLKCSKCQIIRKYVKSYLSHIQNCEGNEEEQNQMDESTTSMNTTQDPDDVPLISYPRGITASVECGVCNETVLRNKWIDHIRLEHKYLAWKKGERPLDLQDEVAVKLFLKNISNYNGGLMCNKCGIVRTYVKSWLAHEAACKGDVDHSLDGSLNEPKKLPEYIEFEITTETVKCGKCSLEMPSSTWIDHIEREHNYLSWIEGQPPLEESNPDAVSAYLLNMVKKRGVLNCVKCGVSRKYPKAFLSHVSACEISGFKREDYFVEVSDKVKPGEYECAICHDTGNLRDWKKHAMGKHYNIAWMAGDTPINLKNPYAVEKYMKEYKSKNNLICKVCGASRASCYGFYAHILTCGKTGEELESLMEMCDICNNKFLCIYRNQHRAMHKEQMIKKEKKEQAAIRAEEEQKNRAVIEEGEPTGKRRAAERAKKVMEKYSAHISEGSHTCISCRKEFDCESELEGHVCQGSKFEDGSDSDVSVKMEGQEESDDDMEGVDSSISDEEEDPLKRKRQPETIPKIILPFKVKDFNYYLAKSFEHFCEMHFTNECLFNNWRRNDYKIISEGEWDRYMPALAESCKLRALDNDWETYKRFEARRRRDITIFTGATVRCMQWVPHPNTDEVQDHYLSVSCFRDADCPRYGKDELPQHPGMLQIWNLGRFQSTPKLAIGLAHDFGTIWAMDWCPSGARDIDPTEGETSRLGLVAIACSNGCAYILSVPRFQDLEDQPIICKLNPVAELRLSMKPIQPPFRMGYQATSISWSPQKGHDVVMVGYADGTTALYDLNTQSTLLKETENGVDIFYPFQDALAENSTITGVALCASADLRRAVGGLASSSVTGATMAGWPRGPIVRSHLAASSVTYTPNWPAVLLCSDDVLTMKSTNEMEWWGGGRRVGGACAAGACARCGRVCVPAPPFVRVLRAHPVYPELKKQIVATVKMVALARKRKLANDDLAIIVEPLTYDETIKKYGLEFKALAKKDRNVASKLCDNTEQCAERFPLSEMPAAAFCPTADYHNRLAIATHAGFLFVITT